MELALGKFTEKVSSESLFTEMYFNLSEELAAYLKKQTEQQQFVLNHKVLSDFFAPYHYLEPIDQRTYQKYITKESKRIAIDIITLNYTDSIEKLTGYSKESHMMFNDVVYWINRICHRHGRLGDTVLLGVNDPDQIANESFKQNKVINDLLVKPTSIASMRSDNDLLCKAMINDAQIIILMGVSLGETDACLWDDVVKTLDRVNPPLIVYFHHSSESIPITRKQLLGRKEEEVRRYLYERLKVPENHQSDKEILIGYNKNIFVVEKKASAPKP